jgi:hypothetical protein
MVTIKDSSKDTSKGASILQKIVGQKKCTRTRIDDLGLQS